VNADTLSSAIQLRLLDLQGADTSLAQLTHRRTTLPELAAIAERNERDTALHNDVIDVETRIGDIAGDQRRLENDVDAVRTRVLAYATADTGLVSVTFGVVPVGGTTVVQHKTVSVQNTGRSAVTYATSFARATTAGGATITTSPASITVPAGGTGLVTLTLTANPATLSKDLDPTQNATYDLGGPIPRDFVAALSGRLVLTPRSGGELRVPVQAAPKLVSNLTDRAKSLGCFVQRSSSSASNTARAIRPPFFARAHH